MEHPSERRAPKPVPEELWLPGKQELPGLPMEEGGLIPMEMPGSQPGEILPPVPESRPFAPEFKQNPGGRLPPS